MGEEVVFNCAIEQLQGAVGVQRLGQAAFTFGRRQAIGRVVLTDAFAIEIVVKPAHRRQQPGKTARRLALLMLPGDQAAQVLDVQRRPAGDFFFGAEGEDFVQVPPIGFEGMRRHLALTAQVSAVSVQLSFHQRTERSALVKRGSKRPSTSAM